MTIELENHLGHSLTVRKVKEGIQFKTTDCEWLPFTRLHEMMFANGDNIAAVYHD